MGHTITTEVFGLLEGEVLSEKRKKRKGNTSILNKGTPKTQTHTHTHTSQLCELKEQINYYDNRILTPFIHIYTRR